MVATKKTAAPYGAWVSALSAEQIAGGAITLSNLSTDGRDAFWLELRPAEQGRTVLVRRRSTGVVEDVTPPPFDVGSRVNEYGGGAYLAADGRIIFSDRRSLAVHMINADGSIHTIASIPGLRFADFALDPAAPRLVCVREDHRSEGSPVTTLVSLLLSGIDPADNAGTIIQQGHDFYSAPRFSPDGTALCWLAWDHPNMPWDGTILEVASVGGDGLLGTAQVIAGGNGEAVSEPVWSPSGVLHFVSDPTGWWNLYRLNKQPVPTVEPVLEMSAEFSQPLWVLGRKSYVFLDETTLSCLFVEQGQTYLGRISDGKLTVLGIGAASPLLPLGEDFIYHAVSKTAPQAITIQAADGTSSVVRQSSEIALAADDISVAQPIEFTTDDGGIGYASWYEPSNARFEAPIGEHPPLIVISHGGPTSMASTGLSLVIQFWTSRGFGVVDVNYGGSTGFGRAYRERLEGQWGVVDVADCIAAARHLVERGLADGDRVMIRGNSAGGYTTLAALTMSDFFKAGASYYGVADLLALATDTHKFESRYLDRLIAPLPDGMALYQARAPINHAGALGCPVIFFQGLDDKVVPPNQAQLMVSALRARNLPVAHYEFAGEGHGFRQQETLRRVLELELSFYGQVFGFTPAGSIEAAEITGPSASFK
jgi:dipeptidyl aminopeptidase/acylaminoacyl peptidase